MCKLVDIYQQTFFQESDAESEGTFRFTRVMKTKQNQYFRIKVLSVCDTSGTGTNGALLLQGISELTGNCNNMSVAGNGDVLESNNWYLGTTLKERNYPNASPELMCNEIPLGDFKILRRNMRLMNNPNNGAFSVSFQICVYEPDV